MVDGVGSVGRESKRAIRWTPTYLFAGSHPNLARFGMDVALNRAGFLLGQFCRERGDPLFGLSERGRAVPDSMKRAGFVPISLVGEADR
jgi:hypothetical protein